MSNLILDSLWQIFMHTLYLFVKDLCFLSLHSSFFAIFLYLCATILKAKFAIHIQQFCIFVQNNCKWISSFQSSYKKICKFLLLNIFKIIAIFLWSFTNELQVKIFFRLMCKIIAISNYDLQTKSSFETICFGARAVLFRFSEFSHEDPSKCFIPKFCWILIDFHGQRMGNDARKRIPRHNHA